MQSVQDLLRLQPMYYFPYISELSNIRLAIFLQHLLTTDGLRDETTPTRYTEACIRTKLCIEL